MKNSVLGKQRRNKNVIALKKTMDVGFCKVEERLVRILFLTFDSFTGIGGTKTEM